MRLSAGRMRSAMVATILLSLLCPLTAGYSAAYLPEDNQVWVKWSLAENLVSKADIEQARFNVTPGESMRPALVAYNNHTDPIFNVTLVAIPQNGSIDYELSQTYAGDPAEKYFARWPVLRPQEGSIVAFPFHIPDSFTGQLDLRFLLMFELSNGTRAYSLTTYHLEGPQVRNSPYPSGPSLGIGVADGAIGVLIGAAATLLVVNLRNRRKRE